MRRVKPSGFCPTDTASLEDRLCETADDKLFNKIQNNEGHILHPSAAYFNSFTELYNLRSRAHNRDSGQIIMVYILNRLYLYNPHIYANALNS